MPESADSEAIFEYHRYMISLHGNQGTSALGWRDRQSQLIRFEAIAKIADLNGHSVLDAGCGHGDLYPYLHRLYPKLIYSGIEQIPELLDEAVYRYAGLPQTNFICADFMNDLIPFSDYIMASGSLNYYNGDQGFIFKAISRLYAQSNLGLAFNLLSEVIPNGLIVAYNPEKIMDYCRSLSKRVSLINDYSEEDFTIFMYH